ncbi:hypothetical protein B0H14DRAFT_2564963 [Mycena olivaceomarginata]|nr:hypothetical protein B0H14DRAFT_2564963 [Mycena olivaceomarginata]
MNINVEISGETIPYLVDPASTILTVKTMIQDTQQIPVGEQRLFINSMEHRRELVNGRHLSSYGINEGTTLHLCPLPSRLIQIRVRFNANRARRPDGSRFFWGHHDIWVCPTGTIGEIKDKYLPGVNGLPADPAELHIYYNETELEDDKTLLDCGIEEESNLDMEYITPGGHAQGYISFWNTYI